MSCDVLSKDDIREAVRNHYAKVVNQTPTCNNGTTGGCGGKTGTEYAAKMGYTAEELAAIPDGANIGMSCGNPLATANFKEGEVVLDLGSGAGINCFMAAKKIGPNGLAIGYC